MVLPQAFYEGLSQAKVLLEGALGTFNILLNCGLTCAKDCANIKVMPTNLDIQQDLLDDAVQLGKHKSKRAAVEKALIEYVNRLKQQNVLKLFGEIDFDPDYDYKSARTTCE